MQRVVNISKTFAEADDWDIRQQLSMTPQERMKVAAVLKKKAYPSSSPDLRAWRKNLK